MASLQLPALPALAAIGAVLSLMGCQATIKEVVTAGKAATHFPYKTSVELAAIGAAAYFILDPLAPNWEVAHTQISDSRLRIDLRMKRFHHGGEGEADQIFKRHAEELAELMGNGAYRLVSYTEGIDSEMTGPRRWSRGVIDLAATRTSYSDR